jgi:hypothetical protein
VHRTKIPRATTGSDQVEKQEREMLKKSFQLLLSETYFGMGWGERMEKGLQIVLSKFKKSFHIGRGKQKALQQLNLIEMLSEICKNNDHNF